MLYSAKSLIPSSDKDAPHLMGMPHLRNQRENNFVEVPHE
jgi:hypothetical protein